MEMLQLKLTAEKLESKSRLIMGKRGTVLETVINTCYYDQLKDTGLVDSANVFNVQHVIWNGVDFRPQLFVTTALQKVGSHPKFARIESIYVGEDQNPASLYLIIRVEDNLL